MNAAPAAVGFAELLPTGVTLCFLDISHQGEVHLKLRDTGNATRLCFKVPIPQLQSSNDMFDTMAFFWFSSLKRVCTNTL